MDLASLPNVENIIKVSDGYKVMSINNNVTDVLITQEIPMNVKNMVWEEAADRGSDLDRAFEQEEGEDDEDQEGDGEPDQDDPMPRDFIKVSGGHSVNRNRMSAIQILSETNDLADSTVENRTVTRTLESLVERVNAQPRRAGKVDGVETSVEGKRPPRKDKVRVRLSDVRGNNTCLLSRSELRAPRPGDSTWKMARALSGEESLEVTRSSEVDNSVYSHSKLSDDNLAYWFANVRGEASKHPVICNILVSSSIDVFGFTETHHADNKIPKYNDFVVTGRSRGSRAKGGVCIGIRKELAEHAVKVFEGSGSNECLMVKLTCFTPNVIVGVFYGNQEGNTDTETIKENLRETFEALDRFSEEGMKIVMGGDMNVHVGNRIVGNDEKVSKGGEYLIDLCDGMGFEFVNNKAKGPSHTHFDLTSKTSRVLDLVITNVIDDHVAVKVDNEKMMTPYRVVMKNGSIERKYTDHLAITGECLVETVKMKRKPKMKVFNYNEPGAREKFQRETNERAEVAIGAVINEPDCDKVLDVIAGLLFDAKRASFKVRSISKKRLKREDDKNLAVKRAKAIREASDAIGNSRKRIPEKVFMIRKKEMEERDEVLEAIDHYKTGVRLETSEEIYDSVMDYNVEILQKNKPRTERAEKVKKRKREEVEMAKQLETDHSESDLKWEEFIDVYKKIVLVNKRCYRDLTWAGHKWISAMYMVFKRIYRDEDIPKIFMETKLKKLYKKKGDKTKLSSYRFIHLKQWAGKVMEKLAMKKLNDQMAATMPKGQLGGVKKAQCVEHISSIFAMMRMKTKTGSGLVAELVDVKKCFDAQDLQDTLHSAVLAGASGKQIRVMQKLHDNTKIQLIGDPNEREEIIKDSTGQGTNWAPLSCSLSMGQSFKAADDRMGNKFKMGDIEIDPLMFVDDALRLAGDAKAARQGGEVITEALDELGLQAHPDKSALLIVGTKKYKDKVMAELEKDPVKVQDFELKASDCETYLGVEISSKGVKDSITRSMRKRIKAAMAKEVHLSKLLSSEEMSKVGWMEALRTLFNSIIVSTLSYGCQAFVNMTKKQENEMELAYKEILYRMLRISKYTQYAAVLLECNMMRMKHIMNQLKICFLRNLIHDKGEGICLEVLTEEERLLPGSGLISEVRKLCEKYGIADVSKEAVSVEFIKDKIWQAGRAEVWKETLSNSRLPKTMNHLRHPKEYMKLSRYQSKLFFAYRVGDLQLKDFRRGEFSKKFGNSKCFMGCSQPDRLSHVMTCDGYPLDLRFNLSDFDYDPENQKKFIEYLMKLDAFRGKYCMLPLLYRGSLRAAAERKLGIKI